MGMVTLMRQGCSHCFDKLRELQGPGVGRIPRKHARQDGLRGLPVAQLHHHLRQLLRHYGTPGVAPQPVLKDRPRHAPAPQLSSLHACEAGLHKRD